MHLSSHTNFGNRTRPDQITGRFPAFITTLAAVLAVAVLPALHGAASSRVKVAGFKMVPALGEKAANFVRLEQWAREAAQAGAEIIVTPEGFLDGYAGNTGFFKEMTAARLRELAESADGVYVNRARELARELGVSLVLGMSELRGDKVFNSSFFIDTGGNIAGRYSKSHLNPKSEALYSPGTEYSVFSTDMGKLGMLICFDRQPPEPARILGVRGAQLVLIPGYSRKVGEVDEILLLRVRAYENGYPIAWVSPYNVMMIDRDGKVLAEDRTSDERIIYATFDLSTPAMERDAMSLRHPAQYRPIVEEYEERPR